MQFAVKPVFIGWIALVVQLPLQLFFTFWAGSFFGSMLTMTGGFSDRPQIPFVICGGITFIAIPLVAYFGKKLNYSRTEYRFCDDHLEFEEGFFSLNRKVIRYKDIGETTLRKGILQRIYGLGSVYLATLATGSSRGPSVFSALGFGNVSASGITVRDVQVPDEIYDKIRALVDQHN
jgi:membrane protein YdbS with pleckstrin-like domain